MLAIAIGAQLNNGGGILKGHVRVFREATLDLISFFSSDKFKIYPNPSFGFTNIRFETTYEEVELTIFNSLGSKISNKTYFDVSSIRIDTEKLASGVYYLNLLTNSKKTLFKLVVK